MQQRKADRVAETVAELIEAYLEKWARPRKRSAAEDERILKKDVIPAWGRRKAKDIVRRDVIELLEKIVDRGSPIAANRTLAVIRRMFGWALSRDIIPTSPCVAVKAPAKESRRDRVLNADEIAALWRALDAPPLRQKRQERQEGVRCRNRHVETDPSGAQAATGNGRDGKRCGIYGAKNAASLSAEMREDD